MLSYLFELRLEETSSDYHEYLRLSLKKGQYLLSTDRAVYSWGLHYYNFDEVFRQMTLPPDGSRILLLGLGLGSIPLLLEKRYHKKYEYTLIEIDEVIALLAEKYVLQELRSYYELLVADAETFVRSFGIQDRYDMVITDIYESDLIPPYFLSGAYLSDLHGKVLADGGIHLQNIMTSTSDDKLSPAYADYRKELEIAQPDHHILAIHRSHMIISDKKFVK